MFDKQIVDYIRYYNEGRLHSSIGHVVPKDGRNQHILTERDKKFKAAREARTQKTVGGKR